MILVVCEGWLHLAGLFQGVWESAGRGKSCVVSRMTIGVDDAQMGDSYTFTVIKEKVEERPQEEVGERARRGVLWV